MTEKPKIKRFPRAIFLGFINFPAHDSPNAILDHMLGYASPHCAYHAWRKAGEKEIKATVHIYTGRFTKKPISKMERMIILLHEQGHAQRAMMPHSIRMPPPFQHFWKEEIGAWRYAFRCIRPEHHHKAREVCLLGLRSHVQIKGTDPSKYDETLLKLAGYKGE